jgi:hypothetical protein
MVTGEINMIERNDIPLGFTYGSNGNELTFKNSNSELADTIRISLTLEEAKILYANIAYIEPSKAKTMDVQDLNYFISPDEIETGINSWWAKGGIGNKLEQFIYKEE